MTKPNSDDSYDNEQPPSFAPSRNRRMRQPLPSNNSNDNIPPSFAPNSSRRKATASSSNISSDNSYANNTYGNNSYEENVYENRPRENSPRTNSPRASRSYTGRSYTGGLGSNNSYTNNSYTNNSHTNNQLENKPLENNNPAIAIPKKRKKHYILMTISLLMCISLIVAAIVGSNTYHWVESRIQKTHWLTNTNDTPEKTWLILGSDQREGEEAKEITGFRMDSILVLTKPANGHSSLISIPRDSLVSVNNNKMKINTVAQFFGKPALTKVVENITGHHIDHVAEIRFGGLTHVVDSIGGIELCYNRTVKDRFSGLDWKAGCHHANGNTALAFSRMRYEDPESDFGRAKRQRMVISAIIKKATSKDTLTNFGKVKKLTETGLKSFVFDEKSTPMSLADMAFAFKEATGPNGISGTVYWTDPNYFVPGVGSSVLLDDDKNTKLFDSLSSGTHKPGTVGTLAEMGK